jgi:hypothetical protein
MMRRVGAFLFLCVLFSCTNSAQPDAEANVQVRTWITASGTGAVRCTVYIEGPTGNSVSGALVTVHDETNKVNMLSYDSNSCTYTGDMEEPEADTIYTVEVTTVLLGAPVIQTIPYTGLSKKPDITVFQDALGNSVLSGNGLSGSAPLQIAWMSCGVGVVYQLAVKAALKTVYAVSTNAETVTIRADIIPSGAYTLEISAQKIYGDPYFKKADYCSMSSAKSMGLSFNVN